MDDPDNFSQLLDDYFAECDERLSIIRRCLLALESGTCAPGEAGAVLDELFRSFHTLKGISGMVGLQEVEQLAHATESFLRAARRGDLTLEGVEALFESAAMTSAMIAARQSGGEAPDPARAISRLEVLAGERESPDVESGAGANGGAGKGATGAPSSARTYRFEFTPSAERASHGVNVDAVRAWLQSIGTLIQATPIVRAEGEIAFEFLVATDADESAFSAWAGKGLAFARAGADPQAPDGDADVTSAAPRARVAALLAPSNVVRVDLTRLDDLMRVIGEIVVGRTRLAEQIRRLEPSLAQAQWRDLCETSSAMERSLRELHEGVMRVRMVPIGEIFDRMQFVARDLSREYRKTVRLEISGRETEIDKYLVERMMDPLLHLVRNAVSHGLESTAEREAAGKPREGRITLGAATSGEDVLIDVDDDGRGIDLDFVADRARAAGILAEGAVLDPATLLDVLCSSGFSTRDEADRGSGRGVGMDVVYRTVRELGGELSVDSAPGRGTRFSVRLPLTLSIADALIVAVGGETFAVPQGSVQEVLEIEPSAITVFEHNEVVRFRGSAIPLVRLARLFALAECGASTHQAFVVGRGSAAVAVAVDRVVGLREIVVRTLRDPMVRVPGVAGATELGDGRAILILDVAALTTKRAPARGHATGRST